MKLSKYLFFVMLAVLIAAFYGCGENTLINPGGNNNPDSSDNGSGGGNGGADNGNTGGGEDGGGSSGGDSGDTGGGSGEEGGGDSGDIINPPLAKIKYVLAGTSQGIYISENNGANWTKTSNSEGIDMSAQWTALADLGNDVVLAGSGEYSATIEDIGKGHGIIRSEDGGMTWHKTSVTEGQWNDFAYLGGNSVLAASNTFDFGGVWRSDDLGKNWTQLTDPLVNSGVVLALLKSYDNSVLASKPETLTGAQPASVRISFDKGVKWRRSLQQPPAISIYQFLLLRNGQGILAAGGANAGLQFTSDLTGYIWTCGSLGGAGGKAIRSLAQLKSGTVLAGVSGDQSAHQGRSSGIYRSTNGRKCNSYGQTNMKSNVWFAIAALDNGDALAGCGNNDGINGTCSGIWRSSDDGVSWTQVNSSPIKDLYIFAMKEIRE